MGGMTAFPFCESSAANDDVEEAALSARLSSSSHE